MLQNKKKTTGILFAASSAVATGSFGLFVQYLTDIGFSSEVIVFFGPAFMGIVFLSITLIKNYKNILFKKKSMFLYAICAGLILFPIYNLLYVQMFERLPAAIASLLHFSNAIVLVLLMRIFYSLKITKRKVVAIVFAITGIVLVLKIFPPDVVHSEITLSAILIGISCAIFLAILYLGNYFMVSNGADNVAVLTYLCVFTAIEAGFMTDFMVMKENLSCVYSQNGIIPFAILLMYLVVLSYANYSIIKAYDYIDASTGSLAFVLEPASAAVLGYIILKESITLGQFIGILVAITAICFLNYEK